MDSIPARFERELETWDFRQQSVTNELIERDRAKTKRNGKGRRSGLLGSRNWGAIISISKYISYRGEANEG